MTILDIKTRDAKESLQNLRNQGQMPAVYYGKNTKSTSVSVALNDFIKVWKEAGESGVIQLKDGAKTVDVLIHEVQVDPMSDMPSHVDFYVFEKGKKIEVSVPLEFVGVSPAVKDLGGNLVKALREVKVSADPQNIPHSVDVDISSLTTFDSVILAKDIKLPDNIILSENEDEVIASVVEPKEEKEETAPVDLSAIEVEKKGKKEEEEVPAE